MDRRLEHLKSGILVGAVLVLAFTSVRREFRSGSTISASTSSATKIHNWKSVALGILGDSLPTDKVLVVEFSDLECPFCRRFHTALVAAVDSIGPEKFTLHFAHFPLPQHRFAIPAAKAAECARTQGKFNQFVASVFSSQDSLGLKGWTQIAHDAGVADTSALARCTLLQAMPTAIVDGIASGKRLGVKGTPTVIVNGWRFSIAPYDSIGAVLRRAVSGEAYQR